MSDKLAGDGMAEKAKGAEEIGGTTTDPNNPRLRRGSPPDEEPVPQNEIYLVLSDEEIAKGFVKPVRYKYLHVGAPGPKYPLRDLTEDERARHGSRYVKYEKFPESESPLIGRSWTQEQLDRVGVGCNAVTEIGSRSIAETYARDPHYYGQTYCVHCSKHLKLNEFVWDPDGESMDPSLQEKQGK